MKKRFSLENAKDAIFLADSTTGLIINCNKAAELLLEKKKAEIIGCHQTILHPPQKAQYYADMFKKHIEQEGVVDEEAEVIAASGKIKLVHITAVVTSVEGKPIIQGIFRDISERKKIEEALQDSEIRYRRLFETAKDGILIIDFDTGQITDVNPFLAELLGYSCEEFLGKKLWEIGVFEDVKASKAVFLELQTKGYVRYEDLPLETKDGRCINVEFVSNAYYVNHKKVIQCNIRDMTARKKAEDALRESEERFRTMFEVSGIGMALVAPSGQFLKVNRTLCEIVGYSEKELLGTDFQEITHPKDLSMGVAYVEKMLNREIPHYHIEKRFIHKNGDTIWILLHSTLVCSVHGEPLYFVFQAQDITASKESQQSVKEAREYAENIVTTIREPLLILSADLRIISANRSFYQTFKVIPEESIGQFIYDLGNRQWDIPKLRELLEEILPQSTAFEGFEVEHEFLAIGKRTMLLNARKIYRETSKTEMILLAIEDITARKELEEKLKTLASRDELTGCVNFRSTMEFLENEIARSKRYQKKFSIIMMDIDNFKRINDEYGHLAGNDVLVGFANVLNTSVRSIDVVGSYGGKEFIIAFPESDPQHALVVLERMRKSLEHLKINSSHSEKEKKLTLTFSAGIAAFPYNAKDLRELLWVADSVLRQAKREGKNQAVLEKRKFIRLKPTPGTRIEIVDPSGKKNVKIPTIANISKEGMLFLSTQDILAKELLCRIYYPHGKSPFEFTCQVKHKGKSKGELYRIGVYFLDIPESIKEKLSKCIESPKE